MSATEGLYRIPGQIGSTICSVGAVIACFQEVGDVRRQMVSIVAAARETVLKPGEELPAVGTGGAGGGVAALGGRDGGARLAEVRQAAAAAAAAGGVTGQQADQ